MDSRHSVYVSSGSNFISGFNDVVSSLLPGHEKALKQAFYNTVAFLFVICAVVAVIAVYLVLQPFLRPLLWALLVGSALHPFKRELTRATSQWMSEIKNKDQPLFVGTVVLPFKIINCILDAITCVVKQYFKLLLFILLVLLTTHLCIYYLTFTQVLISLVSKVIWITIEVVRRFQGWCTIWITSSLVVSHLLAVIFWWNPNTSRILICTSPLVWLALTCKIIESLGSFGCLIVVSGMLLICIGFASSLITDTHSDHDEVDNVKFISTKLVRILTIFWRYLSFLMPSHAPPSLITPSDDSDSTPGDASGGDPDPDGDGSPSADTTSFSKRETHKETTEKSQQTTKQYNFSNVYLYALLWCCLLAQVWLRPHIIYLLPIPLSLFIFKWCFQQLGSSSFFNLQIASLRKQIEEKKDGLYHPSIRTIYRCMLLGDKLVSESLQKSLDSICSMLVIFLMMIGMIVGAVFLSVQVYHESAHLVKLVSNVVNSTVVNNPELSHLFPKELIEKSMIDEMVGNAYVYGRKWIKNSFHVNDDDINYNSSKAIEKQILEVWDRAYHMWLNSSEKYTKTEIQHKLMRRNSFNDYSWNKLMAALKTLNFSLCFNLLKENLDVIISVFDSVWSLLISNVTLLFSAMTAVFSLLLSGSSAILNAFLSIIVFSTSLFYLLCSSGDEYKPIELAGRLLPLSRPKRTNKFGQAVEEAINSVFAASLKMTAFYGLYTWLTHTLFEVQIVFIPSVLAALFGAVPFIGAYWASLPGVIELWLVNGLSGKSMLMALCAIMPTFVVDSAIYSDIKGGGHPYLTALAIAGGIFYLGVEGALFGPILLCCLFVVGNMYTSFMSEGTIFTPVDSDQLVIQKPRPQLKRLQTMH